MGKACTLPPASSKLLSQLSFQYWETVVFQLRKLPKHSLKPLLVCISKEKFGNESS